VAIRREDVRAIRAALTRNGLRQVQFNLPWGDHAASEVGIANNPRRRVEFRDGVSRALEVADQLGCPRLLRQVGITLPHVPLEAQRASVTENLRYAADQSSRAGVRILVEPLNAVDVLGFLVPTMTAAVRLLDEVGQENLRILCDVSKRFWLTWAGSSTSKSPIAPDGISRGQARSTIGPMLDA
jgi:hydroxypyruvate isomerase